jgi:hypothetical protein
MGGDEQLSLFDQIHEIARRDARSLTGEKNIRIFLMSWWSNKFNRPMKDPVLLSYSLEELAYEYYLNIENEKARQERIELENDKIEEAKEQEDQSWADAEEQAELERKAKELAQKQVPIDPSKDPANIAWMEAEIEKAKKEHGQDFGEDVSLDFGE